MESYVSFVAYYANSTFIPPNDLLVTKYDLPLRKCVPSDFDVTLSDEFTLNELEKAKCFEKDLLIGGYWNLRYVKFVELMMTACQNTTTKNDCYSEEKINDFLNKTDKQMSIFYQNIVYSPKNYSNPFRYYLKSIYSKIETAFCKTNEINIKQFKLEIDGGILIEASDTKTTQAIDSINKDSYVKNATDPCMVKYKIYI